MNKVMMTMIACGANINKKLWEELTASVVEWSEFLATDPEGRVWFSALPEKEVVGLQRGPLSLVSTTEETRIRP
jgi:hypothetical protein